MIHFQCPQCGSRYQVADTLAGKSVKCRTCRELFKIPSTGVKPAGSPPAAKAPAADPARGPSSQPTPTRNGLFTPKKLALYGSALFAAAAAVVLLIVLLPKGKEAEAKPPIVDQPGKQKDVKKEVAPPPPRVVKTGPILEEVTVGEQGRVLKVFTTCEDALLKVMNERLRIFKEVAQTWTEEKDGLLEEEKAAYLLASGPFLLDKEPQQSREEVEYCLRFKGLSFYVGRMYLHRMQKLSAKDKEELKGVINRIPGLKKALQSASYDVDLETREKELRPVQGVLKDRRNRLDDIAELIRSGSPQRGLGPLDGAINRHPEASEFLTLRGALLCFGKQDRDLTRGMADLNAALRIDGKDEWAWLCLGVAHLVKGDRKAAGSALHHAERLNPKLSSQVQDLMRQD